MCPRCQQRPAALGSCSEVLYYGRKIKTHCGFVAIVHSLTYPVGFGVVVFYLPEPPGRLLKPRENQVSRCVRAHPWPVWPGCVRTHTSNRDSVDGTLGGNVGCKPASELEVVLSGDHGPLKCTEIGRAHV